MIHNIFEQIDADHSGFIQFAELIDSLDHEGSGHTHIVSLLAYPWPTEILEVFLRVVPQMENEDMQHYTQKILQVFDINKDGMVNSPEFIQKCWLLQGT